MLYSVPVMVLVNVGGRLSVGEADNGIRVGGQMMVCVLLSTMSYCIMCLTPR